jgi:2-methylfumaryl-CoA isomerase
MYGAFGRDFATGDGRRVMVVAISANQWRTLAGVTGITEHLPALERAFGADFRQEGDRYRARHAIAALLEPWFAARTLDQVRAELAAAGVCWGPFQTFTQLFADDWRVSTRNPVFADVTHPGIGSLRTPASPLLVPDAPPVPAAAAPLLGQDTDAVLAEVLGLAEAEIGRLHDAKLVAGAHRPGEAP